MIFHDGVTRDYQLRAHGAGNSYVRTGATPEIRTRVYVRLTWGNAYDPGVTGIEGSLETWIGSGSSTEHYQATLTTPWGTYTTADVAAWPSTPTLLIEIDAIPGNPPVGCDAYEFAFDELRWYVDGALVITIGPQAQSIYGFDERLNVVRIGADDIPAFLPLGTLPHCVETNRLVASDIAINPGGWRWRATAGPGAWTSEECRLLPVPMPTIVYDCDTPSQDGGSCYCPRELPVIDIVDYDSWRGVASADHHDEVERSASWTETTYCTIDGVEVGDPCIFTVHRVDYEYWLSGSWIDLKPKRGGILKRTTRGTICCTCDGPCLDEEGTVHEETRIGPYTVCQSHQGVIHILGTNFCWDDPECPCPAVEPEEPTPIGPPPPNYPDSLCYYAAAAEVIWPDPTCGEEECHAISYDVDRSLSHWRVQLCGGIVYLGRATNAEPHIWTDESTGIGCDLARIRLDHRMAGRIWLMTISTGTLAVRRSTTRGSTWESPVTIKTGAVDGAMERMRDGRLAVVYLTGSGPYTLYAQVLDASLQTVIGETTVDTGVDADGLDLREFVQGRGKWKLGLTYRKSGNLLYVTSIDGVTYE